MTIKLLLISADPITRSILEELRTQEGFNIEIVASSFDGGILTARTNPDCVVLDIVMAREESLGIAQYLRSHPDYASIVVIGLIDDSDNPGSEYLKDFTATISKLFVSSQLADLIRKSVTSPKQ